MPHSRQESIFAGKDVAAALQFLGHPGMIDVGERISKGVTSPRAARIGHHVSPESAKEAQARWEGMVQYLGPVPHAEE